jgi:adenylyl cyclase-associated protein
VVDTVLSSVDTVNCQQIKLQITGTAPTALVDKTDGWVVYLTKTSRNIEIFAAKSSEMNVSLMDGDDFVEKPIPEQFKTTVDAKGNLKTETVEHSD